MLYTILYKSKEIVTNSLNDSLFFRFFKPACLNNLLFSFNQIFYFSPSNYWFFPSQLCLSHYPLSSFIQRTKTTLPSKFCLFLSPIFLSSLPFPASLNNTHLDLALRVEVAILLAPPMESQLHLAPRPYFLWRILDRLEFFFGLVGGYWEIDSLCYRSFL